MQLRYLQTLTEIGGEQNSTIVFPMPIDIVKPFLDLLEKADASSHANGAQAPALQDGARRLS
jgi:hypothetical protein